MQSAENELTKLPKPDEHALEHSERLQAVIRAEIEANGGSLSFARFMELALYAPGLGYYAAGSRKFGREGDFVTAPEISPIFARCLARQCQQVLQKMNNGNVLEFGAGSGVMAADLLLELEVLGCLPDQYQIIEVSPELKARQQQTIADKANHLLSRVSWLEALPEQGFRGVIIANEVLDAMPIHRFRIKNKQVHELKVVREGGEFNWETTAAEAELKQQLEKIQNDLGEQIPDGYESEVSLAYAPWLNTIGDFLEQGLVLLIDYGYPRHEYYHAQRSGGTLMCHYRHRAHSNPFVFIGLQDITAYVDFTAVAEAALDAGLEVSGFNTQVFFLMGCGLDELMAQSDPDNERQHLLLTQQIKTLTMPGEMGERFKVLGLTRNLDFSLRGFQMQDLRDRL